MTVTSTAIQSNAELLERWTVSPYSDGDVALVSSETQDEESIFDNMQHSLNLVQLYGSSHGNPGQSTIDALYTRTLPERLAEIILIESHQQHGVIEHFDRQSVAMQLGTQRETVSALLRAFHRQLFISVGYQQIVVLDPVSLAELAWH